jgi:outer membrane lipoprotein-sorting protein
MIAFSKSGTLVLSACIVLLVSQSASAAALTAREVAEKYDEVVRESHTTVSTKIRLSTCKYRIDGSSMQCVERPRVRVVENVAKYFGRDSRSLGIISEPVGDQGIGILSWGYFDRNKVNDNWLYLPALNKVKRVVAVKDSRDSGSYFGSEFYIEDIEESKLEEFTFKLLGEENVRVLEVEKGYVENPAYVLEWTPTPERSEMTNYGKVVIWIDKERFILLKEELYDHDQVLFKRRNVKDMELVANVWMPKQISMDNLATRRISVMERDATALNIPVQDEYFTQRTLTDAAYRERYLSQFRASWKY